MTGCPYGAVQCALQVDQIYTDQSAFFTSLSEAINAQDAEVSPAVQPHADIALHQVTCIGNPGVHRDKPWAHCA